MRGGKIEMIVGKEWPTIVGIENILLKLIILLRIRMICL
jgi:hypothetical protein